jgi:prevent-host-death family protein
MHTWKLEDAKAKLSEVVRLAREEGPQRITVRGKEAAVVISAAAYEALAGGAKPRTIYEALRAWPNGDELEIPERDRRVWPVRDLPTFE